MKTTRQTRRRFIRQSAVASAGLLVLPRIKIFGRSLPSKKSKVILAHSDAVIDDSGNINTEILQQLLDQSMLELSGRANLSRAWSNYFKKDDVIGMKVNGNSYHIFQGSPMAGHFPLLTSAIINSMEKAGFSDSNTIIWERSDEELEAMGYPIKKEAGSLRILGTHIKRRRNENEDGEYQPWFSDVDHAVGEKSTRLSNILEKECTALINLPCLKSHRLAGVTGALKNHYGSVDNPRDFHENNCCSPGAAEINNIPVIREKHRLVICNALMGLWEGGPRWNLPNMWMEGSLIIGEDPVAVDTVMLQLIDEKRTVAGLQPVAARASHLQLSEATGLGNSRMENIQLIKLEI